MNDATYRRIVAETLGHDQAPAGCDACETIQHLRWRLANLTRANRRQARTIAQHETNLRYAESIISTLRGLTT